MKMIIGLVGEKGGGKGTFVQTLKKLKTDNRIIRSMRFSDILKETLKIWDIPMSVVNLQKLPVLMEEGYEKGILSNAMRHRIENTVADVVILDGVRWETDVKIIQGFSQNALVYITANANMRYERTLSRNEKIGDSDKTFQQFLEEEKAQTELMIPIIGMAADYTIVNEGSLNRFEEKVKYFRDTFLPRT